MTRTTPSAATRFRCNAAGLLLALALLLPGAGWARDHFVAPPGAVPAEAGDGSRARPWATIEDGFRIAEPGDRLILLPGEYGPIDLARRTFQGRPLTIVPETPGTVHATRLSLDKVSNVVIRGLQLWRLERGDHVRLVDTYPGSASVRFERLDLRGGPDAHDYMNWTRADWADGGWRASGITLRGDDNALIASELTGVAFGVTTWGARAEIRGNVIRGFSADAMRGLGEDNVFIGNRAIDAVRIDGNHDDGFQSWATAPGPDGRPWQNGLRVEDNVIVEWTGRPDHPLRGKLQGIGLFDGMYRDLVIRNNLVIVSQYHGIAVYGAQNAVVANNTVLGPGGGPADRPWITVRAHKDGTDPGGNNVANNVATTYKGVPDAQRRNVVAQYPARLFRDILAGDFRPKPGSGLIDTADPDFAPSHDITGIARGSTPDFGAFEAP
ncbi:right-handed parallel beta-helix repeat-containing protein [Jannaschia formosa]|uniref:right-handed parallel beta-helix repeat-containing protein n=1 Tax=Jannaschia formosa TaxID=2259592 RepID=UPI00142F9BFC|nr:right-handed parallel beta-helix repeat-containing protein [Jannaschia formosa]